MPFNRPFFGRRLRHYLRLQYPVEIIMTPQGFYYGHLPDLPGCDAIASTPEELYAALDRERRQWIRERVQSDQAVPRPNTHLDREETVRELRIG